MIRASVTIAGGATLTIVPSRSRYRSGAGPPRGLGMSGMVLGWAPHDGPIVLLLGEADAIEHGIDDSLVAVLGDSTAIHRDCSLLPWVADADDSFPMTSAPRRMPMTTPENKATASSTSLIEHPRG